MTAILPDPQEEFWAQDPSILTEPEQAQVEEIQRGKMPVALGLAAAFLVYRGYMSRRMKQETRRMGADITREALLLAASAIWNKFVPRWVSMTAPYLVAGYIEGVQSAHSGQVPNDHLMRIAEAYTAELGHHLNEVSKEALVSGFQAQVNRKVPVAMAARRVADAYGVPRRGMNALVNIWGTDEQARFTDQPLPSAKAERAQRLIDAQVQLRARQVGDNEHWAARTQAKQIVWMYGQSNGVIPQSARRVWITAHDEKVCEVCGPLDGVSAAIGEKFKTDSGEMWTPPSHINCRCDVVLDLEEDINDELTSLLESESVAKSRAGDPFDRDKQGRFARTESRPAHKERSAEVDALLAQVNEKLSTPVKLQPLSLTQEKTKLTLQPLKAPALIKPLKVLSVEPKQGTKTRIKVNLKTKQKLDLMRASKLKPSIWQPEKIRHQDIDTEEGHWHYMDETLTTVMDPWQHHDIGDTILHDDTTPFYEETPNNLVFDPEGNDPRTLEEAIGDYWDNWIVAQIDEYRNQETRSAGSNVYRDEGTDANWVIPEEAYVTMLEDLVAGTKPIAQEVVYLEGVGHHAGETLGVTTGDMARQLGMVQQMETDAPILMQTKHGMPGMTEKLRGHEWRNPGRWRVVNIREVWDPHETQYHHLGYTILEVEPADLYDTE